MKRILVVSALAVALVLAFAGVAHAQVQAPYSDSTCMQCHGVGTSSIAQSKVDFSAAPGGVDYAKCRACHAAIPVPSWDDHFHGYYSSCGWLCHGLIDEPTFSEPAGEVIEPLVRTSYGYFQSVDSPYAEVAEIHQAHLGQGWVNITFQSIDPSCAPCHGAASCNACHTDPVHGDHGGTPSCISAGCHVPEAPAASPSCLGCHPEAEDAYHEKSHQSTTLIGCGGAGCHNTPDLVAVHTQYNADFPCEGCHNFTYGLQVSTGQTGCVDCHTNMTGGSGHRGVHWASPPLVDASGPNYSYWTGSAGTAPTSDCAMCHTTNLVDEHMGLTDPTTGYPIFFPRLDMTGAPLGCASCHASADASVQTAITSNLSSCESCHDVHGPIQIIHQSTFVDDPEVPCGDCHSNRLKVEHNGTYSVTTPSGRVLRGCDVCHGYFEGERGAEIQAAIGITNDVKCSACHADYHQDTEAHKATSVTSLACAECHGTVVDGAIDAAAVHAGSTAGPCMVCHATPVSGKTAECSSCHTAEGADYHKNLPGAHSDGAFDPMCASCHTADLPTEHEGFLGRYQDYDSTCALCHRNADATRIDWNTATASCASCHEVHGDIDEIHQAPASQACVDCHQTADVRELHGLTAADSCAYCHAPGLTVPATAACVNCHSAEGTDYHKNLPGAHTDVGFDPMCASCHTADLPTEHEAFLGRYPDYATTCALCHRNADATRIDWNTATASCASCHEVHGDIDEIHQAPASQACVDCHLTTDVRELHGLTAAGSCAYCHAPGLAVPATAACVNCHTAEGADYHKNLPGAHSDGAFDPMCASCHTADLPTEHEGFLGRYPDYDSTCALCHRNADATRIDWNTATASCASCHEVHGDIDEIHQAPASQACVDCHQTADVRELHGLTAAGSCAYCHAPGLAVPATAACVNCHAAEGTDYHKNLPGAHLASESGCNKCHYLNVADEHLKPTVDISCVSCHTVSASVIAAGWDTSCAACHPVKHGDKQTKHRSTTVTCSGSGCHDITDVEALHRGLSNNGCYVCHKSPSEPAATTDCSAAGCHAGVGTDHREAHNGAAVNPSGCEGCHFRYLDDEHAALGLTCATCHASTNTVVRDAIAAGDLRCLTCHPDSAHNARQAYEFNPGQASVHRVAPELPGMRNSFVVNGSTYSWSLPSASSFLKSGWTTNSTMTCADCHSYSGADGPHGATMKVNIDPAYPNPYKVTTGSSTFTAQLSPNSPTGMSMITKGSQPAGIICEKCHTLRSGSNWSNVVHKEHDDRGIDGAYCNQCHVAIPHGWGRPRLIGYVGDPAPYAAWAGTGSKGGGTTRISIKSYTPSNWSKSDCGAGCSSSRHPLNGTSWPLSMNTPAPPPDGGTEPPVVEPVNLARAGTATASSTDGSNAASRAIDGSTSTYWRSGSGGTQWLRVDLGSARTFDKVVVMWDGSRYAKAYQIETSADARNWTTQHSTTAGAGGTETLTFSAVSARYVRIYMTTTNDSHYRIKEFEVWGN